MKTRLWKKLNRRFYRDHKIIRDPLNNYILYYYENWGSVWTEFFRTDSLDKAKEALDATRQECFVKYVRLKKRNSKKHCINPY